MSTPPRSRGFTLIELMIVLVIVAILAASAVPIYRSFTSRAYGTEIRSALGALRRAQRAHKAEFGGYASQWSDLTEGGYISNSDFADMKYVNHTDLHISDPGDGGVIAYWQGELSGYEYGNMTILHNGTIRAGTSSLP